jgi:hypothetical protein
MRAFRAYCFSTLLLDAKKPDDGSGPSPLRAIIVNPNTVKIDADD